MRDNIRWKERFELALDAKQIIAVLLGSLVILGGVFVLGISVGRRSPSSTAQQAAAPRDALARLDEPLGPRDEPAPELRAHQALTDTRTIENTLPVVAAKAAGETVRREDGVDAPLVVQPPLVAQASAPASAARSGTEAPPPVASPGALAPPPRSVTAAATRPTRLAAASHKRPGHTASAAASKKKSFTIQVGAVKSRADADRLARRLSARRARVIAANVPGKGRLYRVQIGTFDTRAAADRQLASLSSAGVHGIVIARR